ncbi:MAG: Mur ligase family protein, partial [Rhodospirillales bacterium]
MSAAAMDALWTSEEALAATGGRCSACFQATGITIDSRVTSPGDMFVAIKGPNFDGHDFVADAMMEGAAAAVTHHIPIGVSGGVPVLIVDDTLKALEKMGAFARGRGHARIVAITGSLGKTGVKEALKTVLGEQGPASANEDSLNNHWGLPLSLARMPANSAYGVFEIGMNHPGEIEPLSRLARPHVALITNVEAAHIAFFGSLGEIADAKAEIFAGIEAGGTAVLNRDNSFFDHLAAKAKSKGVKRIIGFGADGQADARVKEFTAEADGSLIEALIDGVPVKYRVAIPGRHWVMNSLAVLGAVLALEGDVEAAAEGLSRVEASKGRGLRQNVRILDGGFQLIDESYNASPVSM